MSRTSIAEFALDRKGPGFDRRIYWSMALGYAGGPFLLGGFLCNQCLSIENFSFSLRLSFGLITSLFSMVSFGFPYDIAGIHRVCMWPYILGTSVVVWAVLTIKDFKGQLPVAPTNKSKES